MGGRNGNSKLGRNGAKYRHFRLGPGPASAGITGHDLRQRRRLEKPENRSKRIEMVATQRWTVPSPGAGVWGPKIMRRPPFHGSGGPTFPAAPWMVVSLWGRSRETRDGRPIGPLRTGTQSQHPGRGITRPMLFEPQTPAPGPRLKYPGNVNPTTGGTPGRAGSLPERN